MRIVFDSNVLVAAMISAEGLCAEVFNLCIDEYPFFVSEYLLTEVSDALLTKLKADPVKVNTFMQKVSLWGERAEAQAVPPETVSDPDDLPILGLAAAVHADYLVTGDRDLLVLHAYAGVQIVTPRQFWTILTGQER